MYSNLLRCNFDTVRQNKQKMKPKLLASYDVCVITEFNMAESDFSREISYKSGIEFKTESANCWTNFSWLEIFSIYETMLRNSSFKLHGLQFAQHEHVHSCTTKYAFSLIYWIITFNFAFSSSTYIPKSVTNNNWAGIKHFHGLKKNQIHKLWIFNIKNNILLIKVWIGKLKLDSDIQRFWNSIIIFFDSSKGRMLQSWKINKFQPYIKLVILILDSEACVELHIHLVSNALK